MDETHNTVLVMRELAISKLAKLCAVPSWKAINALEAAGWNFRVAEQIIRQASSEQPHRNH